MGLLVLLGALVPVAMMTAATIENATARRILYWFVLPPLIIGFIALWRSL